MINQDLMSKGLQRYLKQERRRAKLKQALEIAGDFLGALSIFAMLYLMMILGHAFGLN